MSLKQIKSQIRSINKIHQVTKAMEAVSAVKMRKSQQQALRGRPYARAALSILRRVSGSMDVLDHSLASKRAPKKIALVVITAERGLAGSFNSSVFRKAEEVMKDYEKENIEIISFGKKATEYFRKRDYSLYSHMEDIPDQITEKELESTNQAIIRGYENEDFDRVYLLYNNFVSTFEQRVVVREMLPLSLESVKEMVEGITPESGKYSDVTDKTPLEKSDNAPYEVEPSNQEVLSQLLPVLLSVELYHGMLESKASEHSARMVAMKNASDRASELSREFSLKYNKERQAQITSEVSEIIGGIETNSS